MSSIEWCTISVSEKVHKKLNEELNELQAKGAKLQNGELLHTVDDVITYMLDHVKLPTHTTPTTPTTTTTRAEGWFKPMQSRTFHYFVDGRSLCRHWGLPGELDPDTGNKNPGKEDCHGCFRILLARRGILGVEKIE